MMQLRFQSAALAAVCNRQVLLDRRWGLAIGAGVRRTLCLLAAVPNLELLSRFPGVLEKPIRVDRLSRFRISVPKLCNILVQPDHDPIPYLRTGELASAQIECLVVLEVNGYGL
jgi:hypothetical protein